MLQAMMTQMNGGMMSNSMNAGGNAANQGSFGNGGGSMIMSGNGAD